MALPKIRKQIEARVKDTGDTMTGSLFFKDGSGVIETSTTTLLLGSLPTAKNLNTGRFLELRNTSNASANSLNQAISLTESTNGTWKTYMLYGQHNKPTAGDIGALSTSGGVLTGPLDIRGNAASKPLKARGIVGSDGEGNVGPLYLQYEANQPIHLGSSGGYTISADGSQYSGNAATATKLATAKTIQIGNLSRAFDGTANISYTPYQMGLTRAQYGVDNSMNVIADNGNELGMASLTSSDTTINPGGQTGWHHYINMTWANAADNDGSTTNEWCTQIANKCGTTDLWVRSRSGSSIVDGTAWVAPWVRILTGSNWGHVISKATLGAMGAKLANSYYGLTAPTGSDAVWIRTTTLGLIPYSSGNANGSALGTSSWPFGNIFGTTYYTGTQKGLLAAVQSGTPNTNSLWAW